VSPRPVREAHVVAQAKINLFLRVLAREASGYHQIETLFQRLALGDDVVVRVGVADRSLDCRGADTGPADRNLAWRTAVAYADATGWPDGFAIEIDKHVPVGGGLGGGSADAGAVLRCLDRLNPHPIGQAALLAIAASLGADVPFLTSEASLALAWGRGERMLALPALPERRVCLAMFERGLATADVFGSYAASHAAPTVRPIVWSAERFATWDDIALIATNDLEPAAFALAPDVERMRDLFTQIAGALHTLDAATNDDTGDGDAAGDTAPIALMSGSGASVYLLTPLSRPSVEFELVAGFAEDDAGDDVGRGAPAIVETLTAARVAEVIVRD
jgi:4-diphosphocytidyl-2-C-methyl-D-erythritol kinase